MFDDYANETKHPGRKLPRSEPGRISPAGTYVLVPPGTRLPIDKMHQYLSYPPVSGISVCLPWSDFERAHGTIDSSWLYEVLHAAETHGKTVMLRLLAGVYCPNWLYTVCEAPYHEWTDRRARSATYGRTVRMPVPWDDRFLANWVACVREAGRLYSTHNSLAIVGVTGPADGADMCLGDDGNTEAWKALGYAPERLIEVWGAVIREFVDSFPRQHLSLAISNPVAGDAQAILDAVCGAAISTGVGLQGNWMGASPPSDMRLFHRIATCRKVPVGFQMRCNSQAVAFGGSYSTAVAASKSVAARFIEVWPPDIPNLESAPF